MADFFDDPQHPDRPQHPDYWRLVDAVNYFDGESNEGGKELDEVLVGFVDPDSATYMAIQRALRVNRVTGVPTQPLASMWLDAFVAGVKFQQDGGHQST